MSGKVPRKPPTIWYDQAVPELKTIIRDCVDDCVDRWVKRAQAQNTEQHRSHTDQLKAALKLVLLDRRKTTNDAKEVHKLSPRDVTYFKRFLPLIKRKLVKLLGDKELNKDVVKDIGLLRRNNVRDTYRRLWRKHGDDMRTAHTLGFTKSTAAARRPPAPALPPPIASGFVPPAANGALGNAAVKASLEKRIEQLEAELNRERDHNATLKQRVSALQAQVVQKDEELNALQAQRAQVLPPPEAPDQPDFVTQRIAHQDQCRRLRDQCREQQDKLDALQSASDDLNAKLQEAVAMRNHYESTLALLFGLGAKGAGNEQMPAADEFKEELQQWHAGPALTLESVRPLGQGGHGSVFCKRLHVAVKTIDVEENPDMMDYYFREARVSHDLRHENMAPTLQRYYNDGNLCLVMPYYRAGSLCDITAEADLPPEEAAHVAYQVLQYLKYLHEDENHLHRDIKEDNILVADDGTLKVADLGLCGPIDNRTTGVGTPEYLAPEAVRNRMERREEQKQLLTPAVDTYSLGVTMYKILMKRSPHRAISRMPMTNNKEAWNKWAESLMKETCEPDFHERVKAELLKKKNITDDCRAFILDCLRADPKQRPSARELLEYPFIARRQSTPWERRVAKWLNGRKNH